MIAAKTLSVSINSWSGLQLRGLQLPIVDGIPKSLSRIADFKVHSGFICIPKLKMCQLKRSLPRFRQQAGNNRDAKLVLSSKMPPRSQDRNNASTSMIDYMHLQYCHHVLYNRYTMQKSYTGETDRFHKDLRDVEKVTDMFHNQLRAVFTYPSTVTTS